MSKNKNIMKYPEVWACPEPLSKKIKSKSSSHFQWQNEAFRIEDYNSYLTFIGYDISSLNQANFFYKHY